MKIACLQFNPIQENTYVVWDLSLIHIGVPHRAKNEAAGRREPSATIAEGISP